MDLIRIAARVAAEPTGVPGDMDNGKKLIMRFSTDDTAPNYDELVEDDGTLSSEFMDVVSKLGGSVSEWESDGMSITIPEADEKAWDQHFVDMGAGKYGPAAKMVVEAYSHYDTTDEDGESVLDTGHLPLEEEEDPGPPSDPGPPWDTNEEKRGEK